MSRLYTRNQNNRHIMKTLLIAFLLSGSMYFNSFTTFAAGLNQTLGDESYINDIPFNTEVVVRNISKPALLTRVLQLTEEKYVDDIPFSTGEVVKEAARKAKIELQDEAYVDAIPFNTADVVSKL